MSLNASTELVTGVIPSHANDYDGHRLKELVEKDLSKGIEVGTVSGDKGYGDGDNHCYLEQKGINSAIRLNSYRTQKRDRVVVGNDGKRHKETQYFYGYKDQVSLNASTELVTSVIPGHANDYDGHKLKKLVEKDLRKGIRVGTVAGDKGYDDGENHYYLKDKGINSAIRLNDYRTQKKDKNKEGWLELKQSQEYEEGVKERYKVERKFGEARKWHGFRQCRYVGFIRHAIQTYLTFMALNLKRLVKLLTGVSFRGEVKASVLISG